VEGLDEVCVETCVGCRAVVGDAFRIRLAVDYVIG
jgi:hypothetical protein